MKRRAILFVVLLASISFAVPAFASDASATVTSSRSLFVGRTSATLSSDVSTDDPLSITERGFQYGTSDQYGSNVSGHPSGTPQFLSQFDSQNNANGKFRAPSEVVVDSNGNFYVNDKTNNRIEKFDSSGNYLLQWQWTPGSHIYSQDDQSDLVMGPNDTLYLSSGTYNPIRKFDVDGNLLGNFETNEISGGVPFAIDSQGNLFVNYQGVYVKKLDPSGALVAQFGGSGNGDGQMYSVSAITIDTHDNVFVGEPNNYRVAKFDNDGNYVSQISTHGDQSACTGSEHQPSAMLLDSSDNMYVTQSYCTLIEKFDSSGNFISSIDIATDDVANSLVSDFRWPMGMAWSSDGNILVAEMGNDSIRKINTSGGTLARFGTTGSNIMWTGGVAIDSEGNIFVSDFRNGHINKFDHQGNLLSTFGQPVPWGTSGPGQFFAPTRIAIDSHDHLYIADVHQVQEYDNQGVFIRKWGSYGAGQGNFQNVSGVAVDSSDRVYVADNSTNKISVFDSDGTFLYWWGEAGSGDGQFSGAVDVAVDAHNNVFVADMYNNRIQKFDTSGNYVAQFGNDVPGGANVYLPYSIGIGPDDLMYVGSYAIAGINVFDGNGTYVQTWTSHASGVDDWQTINAIVVDAGNNIFTGEMWNGRVEHFVPAAEGQLSLDVTALECGTTYHYRAYVTDTNGTSYGDDQTFTTVACDSGNGNNSDPNDGGIGGDGGSGGDNGGSGGDGGQGGSGGSNPVVDQTDFSLTADVVNDTAIHSGDDVSYHFAISNNGPHDADFAGGIYAILPAELTFVSNTNDDITCADFGLADNINSYFLAHFSGHHVVLCRPSEDGGTFNNGTTIDFNMLGTANADFVSGSTKLNAVYFDNTYETDFATLLEQTTDNNGDFTTLQANNVAQAMYNYTAPVAPPDDVTTTTSPQVTVTTTNHNHTSGITPTKPRHPTVTIPHSDPGIAAAQSPIPSIDDLAVVKGVEITKATPDHKSTAPVVAKDDHKPWLVLGDLSLTGSNILDLVLLAVIILAIGCSVRYISKNRRYLKS